MAIKRESVSISGILKELRSKKVRVGIFESAHYTDGTPVAYVGSIQEYGYPEGNIPSRSFMRTTMKEKRDEWIVALARGSRSAINGEISVDNMLGQMGAVAAGEVQITISQISDPPLKPSTIYARSTRRVSPGVSDKPLVDTSTLIGSITYEVTEE